jgi:hypothetical protein
MDPIHLIVWMAALPADVIGRLAVGLLVAYLLLRVTMRRILG